MSARPALLLEGLDRRRQRRGSSSVAPEGSYSSEEHYDMWLLPYDALLGLDRLRPHQDLMADGLLIRFMPQMYGRVIFVSHQWLGLNVPDPEDVQLRALQGTLRRLASGEVGDVKANWQQQILFGGNAMKVKAAEWKASLPHTYYCQSICMGFCVEIICMRMHGERSALMTPRALTGIDYCSMPQPGAKSSKSGSSESEAESVEPKRKNSDHRFENSQLAKDLTAAVNSIPSYVERSTLVMVLAPEATPVFLRALSNAHCLFTLPRHL